jgi:hypothetical protein
VIGVSNDIGKVKPRDRFMPSIDRRKRVAARRLWLRSGRRPVAPSPLEIVTHGDLVGRRAPIDSSLKFVGCSTWALPVSKKYQLARRLVVARGI